jgi:ferritin-like metal-binding protein YciE
VSAALNTRDLKLIQYLSEAYGKEKELETALQAHIAMTTRQSYKKRLQQHLRETKGHARAVERRIKQLGGDANALPAPVAEAAGAVASVASKAVAAAKGPVHMLRGTGEQEKLLKNAKTEYSEEAEEIATYTAIETLADAVGDRETAKVARGIRRDEERMQRFLERLIPQLTRAVARDEIPASERDGGPGRRGRR